MTVKELIEQLQQFNPDLPVVVKEGKCGYAVALEAEGGEYQDGDWQPDDGDCYETNSVLIS